jgi:hypothetical protein
LALLADSGSTSIDLSALTADQVRGIEAIDLRGTPDVTLLLSSSWMMAQFDGAAAASPGEFTVFKDAGDQVSFSDAAGWTSAPSGSGVLWTHSSMHLQVLIA